MTSVLPDGVALGQSAPRCPDEDLPHAPGVPGMLHDLNINPPRRPYSHMERGLLTEAHEVESILAAALGYEPYPPGSPGYSSEQVNYVVGDHTPVTLAMEAARTLARLREAANR